MTPGTNGDILEAPGVGMSMLPFLKNKVPRRSGQVGESRYGFTEDDDIIEHSLDELMEAVDAKDHSKLMAAIEALIRCIKGKEQDASQ